MRIAFFGSGEFALPTFDSIRMDGHEIVLVVSQPDKTRGRGKEVSPTVIKSAAIEAGIEYLTPVNVNEAGVVARINSARADLAYVAAFGQKIGPELLGAFPVGVVNLHGSLLPKWRGAAPIQWSIMSGDLESGVTVFRLVERMDAGPILIQRRTGIGDVETADELHDRLARIGCDAVRVVLGELEARPDMPGLPQDETLVTMAPKLRKADGHIHFDLPANQLANRICGLWSWPGACCRFVTADGRRDEIVIIARARIYQGRALHDSMAVGTITELLNVQAAGGELEILEIKPANGSVMEWRDYVNGRHVKPGDRFLPVGPA